jgi:hypothetical protein
VLRVALSAPHTIAVAKRLLGGQSASQAMAPIITELDILLEKWERLHHEPAFSDAV